MEKLSSSIFQLSTGPVSYTQCTQFFRRITQELHKNVIDSQIQKNYMSNVIDAQIQKKHMSNVIDSHIQKNYYSNLIDSQIQKNYMSNVLDLKIQKNHMSIDSQIRFVDHHYSSTIEHDGFNRSKTYLSNVEDSQISNFLEHTADD